MNPTLLNKQNSLESAAAPASPPGLSKTRLDMIEVGGRVFQLLGLPRTAGQIYGLLYLSPKPLTLDEIAELLAIGRSTAGSGSRQLVQLKAIRLVWVHGERRDRYEVDPDLGNLLRAGYSDFVRPRLATSQKRLESMSGSLEKEFTDGVMSREEYDLCSTRLKGLADIQKKLQALMPLADKVF
jgi:DNA-binding transcriptional regulator GbsR (MarR family)